MTHAAIKPTISEQPDTQSTRFGFGANWSDYARSITPDEIAQAQKGMDVLISDQQIKDKHVLDIGSGSGLHALAALNKGAAYVTAVDYDPNSVATTRAVLGEHAPHDRYRIERNDILNPTDALSQTYDIVYSWGVLHHTGDLNTALENAAKAVAPGGLFVIALYKETPLCGFWKIEKKAYTRAPKPIRTGMDWLYSAIYALGILASGRNPVSYFKEYKTKRGMHWMIDARDWLGGTPYESISAQDLETKMQALGFSLVKSYNTEPSKLWGALGTGCAEFVFKREGEGAK